MPVTRLKTHAEVRAEFRRKGVSIAEWARLHEFGRSLVYEVIAGRKACHRGASHKVAVLLGLKAGEIVDEPRAVNAAKSSSRRNHR